MTGASEAARPRPIRVLVVDDSERGRRLVARALAGSPDVELAGMARDGEEALRETLRLAPDAVCLDLQMPRMDGFTFLRLVMAQRPTPVVLVSSYARKADVFRALELGAFDFVAKPDRSGSSLEEFRAELLARLRIVRALRMESLEVRAAGAAPRARPAQRAAPERIAVVGASTGGPPALQRLLADLPEGLPLAVLVALHMPERFTRAFADRLARRVAMAVSEAEDGDLVTAGRVLVAPGGRHLEVVREGGAASPLRARLVDRDPHGRRYSPSVDLLFESAARLAGPDVCAVVLTGMGDDGERGVEAVKAAGGLVLAESEETAVVYGMPRVAVATGKVDEVLRLERIGERIARFARGRRP